MTIVIVDARSVKCGASPGDQGYDAAKKVACREYHIAVDNDVRVLAVKITSFNVQDQVGGTQGLALLKLASAAASCENLKVLGNALDYLGRALRHNRHLWVFKTNL